jgi:hypothetical protein
MAIPTAGAPQAKSPRTMVSIPLKRKSPEKDNPNAAKINLAN